MTKRAYKIPPIFREAIAVHLILQAAGENAANIYVATGAIAPDGTPGQLAVVVKNGYRLIITVGPCALSDDELSAEWPRAIRRLKKMTDAEARHLRDSTRIRDYAVDIIARWTAKKMAHERTDA
mgnify:FL=1